MSALPSLLGTLWWHTLKTRSINWFSAQRCVTHKYWNRGDGRQIFWIQKCWLYLGVLPGPSQAFQVTQSFCKATCITATEGHELAWFVSILLLIKAVWHNNFLHLSSPLSFSCFSILIVQCTALLLLFLNVRLIWMLFLPYTADAPHPLN